MAVRYKVSGLCNCEDSVLQLSPSTCRPHMHWKHPKLRNFNQTETEVRFGSGTARVCFFGQLHVHASQNQPDLLHKQNYSLIKAGWRLWALWDAHGTDVSSMLHKWRERHRGRKKEGTKGPLTSMGNFILRFWTRDQLSRLRLRRTRSVDCWAGRGSLVFWSSSVLWIWTRLRFGTSRQPVRGCCGSGGCFQRLSGSGVIGVKAVPSLGNIQSDLRTGSWW